MAGFSLSQMMVSLVTIVFIGALAFPSALQSAPNLLDSTADSIVSAFEYAQQEAESSDTEVVVLQANGSWMVWKRGSLSKTFTSPTDQIEISTKIGHFTFDKTGYKNVNKIWDFINICDTNGEGRRFRISKTGRIKVLDLGSCNSKG